MGRFILRYRGVGPAPAEHLDRIRSLPDLSVVDESSPRMLLVEAMEKDLKVLVGAMPDWTMTPERTIKLPSPGPVPRSRPK